MSYLEPESKKIAKTGGEFSLSGTHGGSQSRPASSAGTGFSNEGVFSEEIMVPDKIVGLSKFYILTIKSVMLFIYFFSS